MAHKTILGHMCTNHTTQDAVSAWPIFQQIKHPKTKRLDDKHVSMKCLQKSDSQIYNFKDFQLIVILTSVDSDYIFIRPDVGSNESCCDIVIPTTFGGHAGRVVTLLPPISEAGVWFPAWLQVGKLVVACRWSAVYSTEP